MVGGVPEPGDPAQKAVLQKDTGADASQFRYREAGYFAALAHVWFPDTGHPRPTAKATAGFRPRMSTTPAP